MMLRLLGHIIGNHYVLNFKLMAGSGHLIPGKRFIKDHSLKHCFSLGAKHWVADFFFSSTA